MAEAGGFVWRQRKNGDVVIEYDGIQATILWGHNADRFVSRVAGGQADQDSMARITGNYKRGNERAIAEYRSR
jgi:hypothetical protein